MAATIDPRAVVDPGAVLASDAEVGPYSIIGPDVEIGSGTSIGPHVVVNGPSRIGARNKIYQFASIGEDPQDKKYSGSGTSTLEIGDDNTIREYCTINRGTEQGGGVTRIGSRNWIMAYVHIAHDCQVGSDTIFANCASLAGHVTIQDRAVLGGFTIIHQFCRIGAYAMTAMGSSVLKDVPPYVTASGTSATPFGLNAEGLKRAGFSPETLSGLRKAYRILYRSGLSVKDAIEKLQYEREACPEIGLLIDFLGESQRGIIR